MLAPRVFGPGHPCPATAGLTNRPTRCILEAVRHGPGSPQGRGVNALVMMPNHHVLEEGGEIPVTTADKRYREMARAYVEGVRELLTPSAGIAVRGAPPQAPDEVATIAERLVPVSEELTEMMQAQLAAADPQARIAAENALLAKALTDLRVCMHLLDTAMTAEGGASPSARGEPPPDEALDLGDLEEHLGIITGEEATGSIPVRGADVPQDVLQARAQLNQSVTQALEDITQRTGNLSQSTFAGLLALGGAELARAVELVGLDVAELLGQADKVTRLYQLFREFVLHTYKSLLALLGEQALQGIAQQVVTWLNQVKRGPQVYDWLAKLYETPAIRQEVTRMIAQSQVELQRYLDALREVKALDETHRRRAELIEKLVRGLKFFSSVPAVALPQGRLFMAATYVILTAYIVLTGADYVDAQRLRFLDRVPGVPQVVKTHLTEGQGAEKSERAVEGGE